MLTEYVQTNITITHAITCYNPLIQAVQGSIQLHCLQSPIQYFLTLLDLHRKRTIIVQLNGIMYTDTL